jgi:metallo-beta-lactamase class B
MTSPITSEIKIDRRSALTLLGGFLACSLTPTRLKADDNPDWTTPLPPFKIAGNLYYVGSRDLASYLVATPAGHILINSNLLSSPAQIQASMEKLGFHFKDVKILLISHAHYDHCAGSAAIVSQTHAKYMVMDADIPTIESGGLKDFQYSKRPEFHYPPVKVDHSLHDGEAVHLGGSTLIAHKTAGHTKGCTTWTMQLNEGGKSLNAVIVGSPNVNPGYNLINDPNYPQMAADFKAEFPTLKSLPCDIFLGAHGLYFDLLAKVDRVKSGDKNAFIDPSGYQAYIADRQQAFEEELAKQQHRFVSMIRIVPQND